MSSFAFPSLDALRPQLPKEESTTEWVALLGVAPSPTAQPVKGWRPPTVATAVPPPAVDLEAARAQAEEAGFCAGYLAGQKAGAERGVAEGRRLGRDEGRQEVVAAESASLVEFRNALAQAASEVGPAVGRWQEAVEARATELAMDAVRALLAAELAIRQPDAMGVVREALGFAEGAIRATIRLAPFDRAALAERKEEILQACASLRDVELVDDRSLIGGCVVETEQGIVDATLATRLSLLEAA